MYLFCDNEGKTTKTGQDTERTETPNIQKLKVPFPLPHTDTTDTKRKNHMDREKEASGESQGQRERMTQMHCRNGQRRENWGREVPWVMQDGGRVEMGFCRGEGKDRSWQ